MPTDINKFQTCEEPDCGVVLLEWEVRACFRGNFEKGICYKHWLLQQTDGN